METSGISENRNRHQWRILRPLFWWLLLVLVLFGIRTHQRLMEKTRLNFSVTLQGQAVDSTAAFDGKPAFSGQNIPLGNHTFAITHPKGVTFSTNMFIWYGAHDLGTIDLKRKMGTLSVTADPPAPFLFIRGPEWSVTLTNSSGLTTSVPTDQYTVESRYAHWGQADDVTVYEGLTATWRFAPRLGAVQLSCNQSDATFQLLTLAGQQEETGSFPDLIRELPEGSYKLFSLHHGHDRNQTVAITAGMTNDHPVEFLYGAAVLETEPAGADVQDASGRYWGATPLNLQELSPGTMLQLTLHRVGYEPVPVTLEITANQTATIHTNLISTGYTGGMKSARLYMAAADYDKALQALGDALIAKPGDADAMALQRDATGLGKIQNAKKLAAEGDYIGGGKELALALQSLPDNAEAKQLIPDYKQHEPEQIERMRVERLNRPKQVFDHELGNYKDANLFDEHELKTSKPAKDVASAIASALLYVQPAYRINENDSPKPETYRIVGMQDVSGVFVNSGLRRCIIVCGQTTDSETEILYKVMEYKAKHNVSMHGLLDWRSDTEFIPIHPSTITNMTDKLTAQLQAGVSNMTVRIQGVIGQTPAPAVQPAITN